MNKENRSRHERRKTGCCSPYRSVSPWINAKWGPNAPRIRPKGPRPSSPRAQLLFGRRDSLISTLINGDATYGQSWLSSRSFLEYWSNHAQTIKRFFHLSFALHPEILKENYKSWLSGWWMWSSYFLFKQTHFLFFTFSSWRKYTIYIYISTFLSK